MSITNQRSVISQMEDADDDDETAFHSADDGEDESEEDDQILGPGNATDQPSPPVDTSTRITEVTKKATSPEPVRMSPPTKDPSPAPPPPTKDPSPAPPPPTKDPCPTASPTTKDPSPAPSPPTKDVSPAISDKSSSPEWVPRHNPAEKAPSPSTAEKTAAATIMSSSIPTASGGDDGWDLDDWDAVADDEQDDGAEEEDIMCTPSSEKPPTRSHAQQPSHQHQRRSNIQQTSVERQSMIHQPEEQPRRRTDDREPLQPEFLPPTATTPQKPASLWGGWGQQLFSLASDSISTLTTSVGEGLTSVLETMETTVGAPTPEELAKLSIQERDALRKKADQVKEPAPVGERDDCDSASEDVSSEGGSDVAAMRSDKEDAQSSGYQSDVVASNQQKSDEGFTSLFTGMSSLLENTGKTIVSGSLDVLETLGKKTFETVTVAGSSAEGQRRRLKIPIAAGADGKPTLSQVLRELKEKAENEAKLKQQEQEARKGNYAALFEDAQGLVYLEALELLSSTCCQQTRSLMELLTPDQVEEISASMDNFNSVFDDAAQESFGEDVEEPNFAFTVKRDVRFTGIVPSRLLKLDSESRTWITNLIEQQQQQNESGALLDAKDIYERCLLTLATFTAASVDVYHKIGQQLLIPNAIPSKWTNVEVDRSVRSLASFTRVLCDELAYLSARFSTCLSAEWAHWPEPDGLNRMLTNVFFEAGNSAGYIREEFKLMMPIVQLANIRERLR